MKIIAVVATYNRKVLLAECIDAVRQQTLRPQGIIVVNNSSTDGTAGWLAGQTDLQVITQPNRGGAYGFYTGIKAAYAAGADWVWVMDDDTIPGPTALEALAGAVAATRNSKDRFGFFVSRSEWTDGNPHLMNIPLIEAHYNGQEPRQWLQERGLEPVRYCSFVSLLVSREAIRGAGLPVKELFIWYDDYEYTTRLNRSGFRGAYVPASVVLHKTPTNYTCDVTNDTPANLWKYRYGIRNELYARRYTRGYGSFLRNTLKRMVVLPFKIISRRKADRWPFVRTVWQASWEALWFNPRHEGVD